jgi:hypothetical protein
MEKVVFRCAFAAALLAASLDAKTVAIVPITGKQQMFFDPSGYPDGIAHPFCALREALEQEGYDVVFSEFGENSENATAVVVFNESYPELLDNLSKLPKERCLLFLFDPPVILPRSYHDDIPKYFGKIFTQFDDFVDGETFFKFHYPQPRLTVIDNVPSFSEKKLSTFIASNLSYPRPKENYTTRRELVSHFMRKFRPDFDLYGTHWEPYPSTVIPSKWEVIKNYRFCFCYENMRDQQGYITEKIFDAMVAGAVPIYFGATNIETYIPKSCFIDRRDFASLDHLYWFMKSMDETTYLGYRTAIQHYLASPEASPFSITHFINTILSALKEIEASLD